MAGSRAGGLKAAAKNLANDPDHYRKAGALSQEAWRRNGRKPRGFAADRELARIAGSIGGKVSRRGKREPQT